MKVLNDWGPVLVVILGYLFGFWISNKRLDDFKEGLYKYLGAEFKGLNEKIDHLKTEFSDSLRIHELEHHK